jgi:hypothetical protein
MAEWIKCNQGLYRETVIMAQARALNLDTRAVAYAWLEVWMWARERTATGLVRNATPADIDAVSGIDGFSKNAAHWIKFDDSGARFYRWEKHNSNGARERATAQKRKANQRSKEVTEMSRSSVTKTVPEQSRAEQSRLEEDIKQGKAGSAPPVVLDGDRLRLALLEAGVPEGEVWGLMTHEKASNANLSHAAARMHEERKRGKVIKHPVKYAMRVAWGEPNTREKWAGKAKGQFDAARLKLANGGAA